MKLLLSALLTLGLASTAFAAPKMTKSALKSVMTSSLKVAKVKHPGGGLDLFDACVSGNKFKSISQTPVSKCKTWETELVSERISENESLPRYITTCSAWSKAVPTTAVDRLVKKATSCHWVEEKDHTGAIFNGEGSDMVQLCEYKSDLQGFPLTQTVEVHTLKDSMVNRTYYNEAVNGDQSTGYRNYSYTIPFCQNADLPDTDIPDTKKKN